MTTITARANLSLAIVTALQGVIPALSVQTDPNAPYTPPQGLCWARLTFLDGEQALAAVSAPGSRLFRGPVVVLIDFFSPAGSGDGDAVAAFTGLRPAMRAYAADGLRFRRFQSGFEQLANGWFQKQTGVVFDFTERG